MHNPNQNKTIIHTAGLSWIILGSILLIVSLAPVISGDGEVRLQDVIRIFRRDALPITQFSVIQPILSVPLYWIGALFSTPEVVTAWLNSLVFFAFFICLYRQLPTSSLRFYSLVFLLCASMIPHYLNRFDGEIITSTGVALGFLFLTKNKIALGTVLFSLGVAQTPASLPALMLALGFFAYKTKNPKIFLLITLPILLIITETLIKHGAILNNPYLMGNQGVRTLMPYSGLPGFSYPFFLGLISIFFSFGKGLIFFIPGIFLRFTMRIQPGTPKNIVLLIDTLLVFVLGLILTYSKWWAWYGGASWGPRFFIIACVPASLLLAIGATQNDRSFKHTLLYCFALTLSAWVCLQGFVYGTPGFEICQKDNYALEHLCWYVPEFSPLWHQFLTGFAIELSTSKALLIIWSVSTVLFCVLRKLLMQTSVTKTT